MIHPVSADAAKDGGTPAVDAAEFARLVRGASDDQLADGFATNRDEILREVFSRMPEHFDASRGAEVSAVVEWRIRDRPGGGHDAFQLVIHNGSCTLAKHAEEDPDVIYEIGPVDFIKLVTGNAQGPKLFVLRRLKIKGDLFLAGRMQFLFRLPTG